MECSPSGAYGTVGGQPSTIVAFWVLSRLKRVAWPKMMPPSYAPYNPVTNSCEGEKAQAPPPTTLTLELTMGSAETFVETALSTSFLSVQSCFLPFPPIGEEPKTISKQTF